MNLRQTTAFFAGIALISGGTLQAQDNQVLENDFFSAVKANQMESYVTFSQGIGTLESLVFEAMIAPTFLLRTNYSCA